MKHQDPSIENNLIKIGQTLKNKREELSYTLEQVAEITRISISSIRVIEDANLEELPSLVFVRGFIRNYAKLLELDSDWMVEDLNEIYSAMDKNLDVRADMDSNMDLSQEKDFSYLAVFGIAFIAILIIAAGFYFFYFKSDDLTSVTQSTEASIKVSEVASLKASEEVKPEPVAEQAPVEPVKTSLMTLILKAKENGWLRIKVDSKDEFEYPLVKGQTYEWPADEEYTLMMTTGNTADIFLNGEELQIEDAQKNTLFSMTLNRFSLTQQNN